MKNKLIVIILVLLMLVPSVVAIINYSSESSGSVNEGNTLSVSFSDINGNEFLFTHENKSSDMIDFFVNAVNNAEEVSGLPSNVEEGDVFDVTLTTTSKPVVYKFYFSSTSPEDCYFKSYDGKECFKLAKSDADKFISGAYSASLYENGTPPTLTVSGKDAVADSANWHFKNYKGAYVEFDSSQSVAYEVENISLEGGISMSFPIEPDDFKVKITDKDSGTAIYDDAYANITGLTVTKNMNVTVEATASWYEDESRNYYGTQTYIFDAVFGAPAHFYAGTNEIKIGEFICVTAENVSNVDDITFSCEPDISYTPKFFKDGEYAHALIPFSWNLSSGDYVLTFSYGGSTQQINVKLANRASYHTFKDKDITIINSTIESFGSDEVREKCENTLRDVAKTAGETRYWKNGELLYYDDDDLRFALGFGNTFKVSGTDISFRNTGVDFSVKTGTDICANMGGEIIYAGFLDYSGYTVVIEHGYGLKTWYAHLSGTDVKVGDVVKQGDVIGKAGNSGFTATEGVHIGMTIFDVPVCQYALWKNSDRPEGLAGMVMYSEIDK